MQRSKNVPKGSYGRDSEQGDAEKGTCIEHIAPWRVILARLQRH